METKLLIFVNRLLLKSSLVMALVIVWQWRTEMFVRKAWALKEKQMLSF